MLEQTIDVCADDIGDGNSDGIIVATVVRGAAMTVAPSPAAAGRKQAGKRR
jgi:hypothetical protein